MISVDGVRFEKPSHGVSVVVLCLGLIGPVEPFGEWPDRDYSIG